jgi:sugar phosphate isomerase/epimerase
MSTLPLGYALNAFPYDDLRGMLAVLRHSVPRIKRAAFPRAPFPVELRFSQQIVDALGKSPEQRAAVRDALCRNRLRLLSVNAFVPRCFHRGRPKENVYLPAWNRPRRGRHSRVAFTNDCIALVAALMDDGIPFASVSAPAGVLKKNVPLPQRAAVNQAIARAVAECARFAHEIFQHTGRKVLIALEPEPGLTCETTEETIQFFQRHLWKILPRQLRPFVGVNFDLCHQLVQWEEPLDSVRRLLRNQIPLAKIHLTNAIQLDAPLSAANAPRLDRLRRFYARSKYLHQTNGVDAHGRVALRLLDLPELLAASGLRKLAENQIRSLRIHYHMPLFDAPDSLITTTLPQVLCFLDGWKTQTRRNRPLQQIPLIIETYTWLEQLRPVAPSHPALCDVIARELRFVRCRL